MNNIVIYGKDNCSWCVKAKELVAKSSVPFTYKTLTKDKYQQIVHTVDENIKTVPIIFIDGEYIGGYEELVKAFK